MRGRAPNGESVGQKLDRLSMPEPNSGCQLWLGSVNAKGYGKFGSGGKNVRAHREAWIERNGPVPRSMHVCHRCDVRSCINPDHLFLGTAADNNADMMAKGRHRAPPKRQGPRPPRAGPARGETHCRAKLTESVIRVIRASDLPKKVLARRHGVDPKTIRAVISRKCWAHVQ